MNLPKLTQSVEESEKERSVMKEQLSRKKESEEKRRERERERANKERGGRREDSRVKITKDQNRDGLHSFLIQNFRSPKLLLVVRNKLFHHLSSSSSSSFFPSHFLWNDPTLLLMKTLSSSFQPDEYLTKLYCWCWHWMMMIQQPESWIRKTYFSRFEGDGEEERERWK